MASEVVRHLCYECECESINRFFQLEQITSNLKMKIINVFIQLILHIFRYTNLAHTASLLVLATKCLMLGEKRMGQGD